MMVCGAGGPTVGPHQVAGEGHAGHGGRGRQGGRWRRDCRDEGRRGCFRGGGRAEEVQGDLEGHVEDDVPDGAVWMGGRVSGLFEGKTWD